DAEALELLGRADTLAVDKTGTLTEGKPRLESLIPVGGADEKTVLGIAAGLERGSEHPLAHAILEAAKERKIEPVAVQKFQALTGMGVQALADGEEVLLGSPRLARERHVSLTLVEEDLRRLGEDGQTAMILARSGKPVGVLGLSDRLRPTTTEAMASLHGDLSRIVMITGDNRRSAERVGKQAGIETLYAEVLPGEKAGIIRDLQSGGHIVAMAGDGINDAPALAQAQVGIALGSGTDIAMDTAGITLVKGDLRGIARARKLSLATLRGIRQNLFLAFAYNVVAIPVAAGILYPLFGILINPVWAGLAMSFSSLSVVANALRLQRQRL
ncbi:MAG: HAD-IC family P-type ATPase, partial [Gemmataceae bacterium]